MSKVELNKYPRPQLKRDSFILLDGLWDFAFDYENKGIENGYHQGFKKQYDINVPFAYQCPLSNINITKRCDSVFYQKEILINHQEDERVILHLEGSDYLTTVYVNGKEVGQDSGAYHRLSFDITDELYTDSPSLLVIHCNDDYSREKPRGKQRWKDENFECWYIDTTGIYKSVWIEVVNKIHITNTKINAFKGDNKIYMDLSLSTKLSGSVEIKTSYEGKEVKYINKQINNEDKLSLVYEIENPKLWNLFDPQIYDIDIILKSKNDEIIDKISTYTAFRKVFAKNGKIYINDKEIYQKMVLDQGYFLEGHLTPKDENQLYEDITKMIDLGFNTSRKHEKIEDDRFYYYADMLGYLIWADFPNMYDLTDKSKEVYKREYLLAINQLFNHPSIITWVPFNESWGIWDIAFDKPTQQFVNEVYYLTKQFDDTRFCITNDGWEHTISDIITIHDYEQDGKILKEKFSTIEKTINDKYEWRGKKALAENYSYQGQPIIMSEFGGTAYEKCVGGENKSWGYGSAVKDDEDFINRFDSLVSAIKSLPHFVGYCYTQVSDVQQEVNGLLKENREFKIDPKIISTIQNK
ncbi:MAG: glycoside hydrolase family 2 protein [Bacilli bacterium]